MTNFKMSDSRWKDTQVNHSVMTMRWFGSVETCLAQALFLAGYTAITPGIVAHSLPSTAYVPGTEGAGQMLDFGEVHLAYPQFLAGQKGYTFAEYRFDRHLVTVLIVGDVVYNPFDGSSVLPLGAVPTGRINTASITPA